jgi:hypothetical protein
MLFPWCCCVLPLWRMKEKDEEKTKSGIATDKLTYLQNLITI